MSSLTLLIAIAIYVVGLVPATWIARRVVIATEADSGNATMLAILWPISTAMALAFFPLFLLYHSLFLLGHWVHRYIDRPEPQAPPPPEPELPCHYRTPGRVMGDDDD